MATKKNRVVSKTRRSNGEGSIYQQKNGSWSGKIWVDDPISGERKRKTVYGKSESEVAKKMVEMAGSMSPLNSKVVQNKNFGELFEDWLMVFKKSSVAPRTFESSVRNYNLHIKPYIGNMKVENITTPILQQIVNTLFNKGLASATIKKVKFLLNQFFEYATDCELIINNPTSKVKIRSRDVKIYDNENKYKAIPLELRMEFLTALNTHSFLKPLCMTSMFAGLRVGELLALRWENIDFKNKTIHVRHGITQLPKFDEKGKVTSRTTVISDTKTACSVREIPIPDILVEALKDWKKEQWVKEQLMGANLLAPNAIVFCNQDGTVRTYAGTRHIYDRFAKRHGFYGKIHFHTLRHTYSNILFESGENPKIIQALLGHKSVKTTLTVYNSVDKTYFKEATEKLNNLFNSETMQEYQELEKKKDIPALKRNEEEIEQTEFDDPEIIMLEKLLAEKKAKIKDNFEM